MLKYYWDLLKFKLGLSNFMPYRPTGIYDSKKTNGHIYRIPKSGFYTINCGSENFTIELSDGYQIDVEKLRERIQDSTLTTKDSKK